MVKLKSNQTHTKWKCQCEREYWAENVGKVICPDCKLKVRFFRVKIQIVPSRDFVTIFAHPGYCLLTLVEVCSQQLSVPMLIASGFHVDEISQDLYNNMDHELIQEMYYRLQRGSND